MSDWESDSGFLRVRSEPDEDVVGIGQLWVEACADGFGGYAEAWFSIDDLTRFAHGLSTYPLPPTPLSIRGGYGDEGGRKQQETVVSSCAPMAGGASQFRRTPGRQGPRKRLRS